MSNVLTFNDVNLEVIERNNQLWVRGIRIGYALGYQNPAQAISKLYDTHADEFTEAMTAVVTLPTEGGPQNIRIFSLRGCHLLAMFARTPVAKQFRKWVLDVLDSLALEETPSPAPADPLTLSTTESRKPLRALVYAWSQVSGQHISALWPQVKAHFQLARIDDLPEAWLPDALAFVQDKIDSRGQQAQLAAPQLHALPCNDGPAGLTALLQLGYMPYDPSPISHQFEEDRELDNMFCVIRGFEHKLQGMEKANKLPPIPKGQEANARHLRETFLASCYIARRALGALFELGKQARKERGVRAIAGA